MDDELKNTISKKSLKDIKSPASMEDFPASTKAGTVVDQQSVGKITQSKHGTISYEHVIGEMPNGKPIKMNLYDKNKRFKDPSKYEDNYSLNSLKSPSPSLARYGYDCIMKTNKHHIISG